MNDRAEDRDDESERGSTDASESDASPPDADGGDAVTGDGASTDRPDDERESKRAETGAARSEDDATGAGSPSEDAPETEARSATDDDERRADPADASPSAAETTADDGEPTPGVPDPDAASEDGRSVPEDVRKYARFKKMDGAQYDRVNEFLRDRTYITAREWAIARLCADFRTETGVEMTKIGENLPDLVPFMTDTYTPQAVNQARSSFDDKIRKAGATFLYGAMCDFYTAEELDDVMYEVTEVSKFLLEVEGVDLSIEDELEAEERISSVMREVREASKQLREEETLTDDASSDPDDGDAGENAAPAGETDGEGADETVADSVEGAADDAAEASTDDAVDDGRGDDESDAAPADASDE